MRSYNCMIKLFVRCRSNARSKFHFHNANKLKLTSILCMLSSSGDEFFLLVSILPEKRILLICKAFLSLKGKSRWSGSLLLHKNLCFTLKECSDET